jgi:SAM-dependent methyltransferase
MWPITTFDVKQFDLIVLFYHRDRRLFAPVVRGLKPGGLFIVQDAGTLGSRTSFTFSN